jgi:hypothetical protein
MNIPSFHDGHFDGFRIGPNKELDFFLRTHDGKSLTLTLQGVDALTLSEIKQGNIIFDLVFRSGEQLTTSDMQELFDVEVDATQASTLLKTKRDMGLQLLELNASYGAHGLVLFQTVELRPSTAK